MRMSKQPDPALLRNPLWYYICKFRLNFGLGMLFLVITNILDAIYPLFMAKIIDLITNNAAFDSLLPSVGALMLTMAGLAASRYAWRIFFGAYHTLAAEDLRNRLMSQLLRLTPNFYQKNQLGELMSLLINDIQAFRQSIGSAVLILVDGLVMIVVILPIMIDLNPEWTWKTLIFLPLVPFLIRGLMNVIYRRFKEVQDRLSELSGFSQESVSGIRVIKSFAVETERARDYHKLSDAYEKANIGVAMVDSLWSPVMYFGVASGTVILLFIGLEDVLSGAATLGTLVAFQRYISKMVWPMTALGMGISQYKKGMAAFDRIKAVLLEKPSVNFGSAAVEAAHFEGVDVKDLTFTYPESREPALKGVTFHLAPGEKIGITGPVGSGKSTLLHLLLGFHPVPEGSIRISGRDLHDWDEEKLRQIVTLIPQDVFLFSESVRDNVRYALAEMDSTGGGSDSVERMLERVQILDEMKGLPGGLEATLGEKGINLSGGQKQRLALARGLLRPSAVILMDDVLSAVDYRTEASILHELHELRTSCLIVSHRVAALRQCDRILVLNQGGVEALGSFDEVLAQSAFFRDLYRIQGQNT